MARSAATIVMSIFIYLLPEHFSHSLNRAIEERFGSALLLGKALVVVGELTQGSFFQADPLAQNKEVGWEEHQEGPRRMHQQGKGNELQRHHQVVRMG